MAPFVAGALNACSGLLGASRSGSRSLSCGSGLGGGGLPPEGFCCTSLSRVWW